MARRLVLAFGWFVVAVGVWVLVQPQGLVSFADLFLTPSGLWVAVALRLAFGALLWVAAPGCRTPTVFRILGALVFLSGLALPVVGLERMQDLAAWGAAQPDMVLRLVALVTAGLGAFIVWSASPRRSES
jgi:hypothetical protein